MTAEERLKEKYKVHDEFKHQYGNVTPDVIDLIVDLVVERMMKKIYNDIGYLLDTPFRGIILEDDKPIKNDT